MLLVHIGIASTYVHSIKFECFHHKTSFSQTSLLLFMFQCNEHVEMNTFLCSLDDNNR